MTYARRNRPPIMRDPATWEPARGSHGWIPLDGPPTRVQDWPRLPPGANESGLLVELDLDDVTDGRSGGVRR